MINNTDNPINFLKIDACISDSNDTTRCDCAIYDNNTFCFIELKCIKPSTFSKNRKTAEKQLEATHFMLNLNTKLYYDTKKEFN